MELTLTPFEALEAAVAAAGSQQALADICGVSQTAVWKWLQSSKRLPGEYALRVEAATGVSRTWLAPDYYPRGLQDGVPFNGDEPFLPVIGADGTSNREPVFERRTTSTDRRAGGNERIFGVAP